MDCKVETFSRVTGFFRPVQDWNEGKTEEFKDRKKYNINTQDKQEAYDGKQRMATNGNTSR